MMKRLLIAVFLLFGPGLALGDGQLGRNLAQLPGEEIDVYLVSLEADMRSADDVMSKLQRVANENVFNKDGVRRSAYLAAQAISIVHARAQQLEQAGGLNDEDRANVRRAVTRLTDASASVGRLQTSIEIAPIVFRRQDERNVRNEAIVLRAQLGDARDAIDEVTNGYAVAARYGATR